MKLILSFISFIASIPILAQNVTVNMITDTIDYDSTRMYIEIPELSRKLSNIITDDEGFWICFPLLGDSCIRGTLIIDYSVMNRNSLIDTKDYDVELWNTFNRNFIGSRSFIKNDLFYRIDRYEDGLQVFYIDVNQDMVEAVNNAMQSIYKRPRFSTDSPVKIKRKISKNNT